MNIESFGISDIGKMRSNNEDIWAALPDRHFYILADGMGGHKAGEVAAAIAMQSMCASLSHLSQNPSIQETCMHLRTACAKANHEVLQASCSNPDYAGMGTTLSCCLILDSHLIYAHVGDSRLYRYRDHTLEQLTEDHSLQHTAQNTIQHRVQARHVITRAVGSFPIILPDIGVIPLVSKDIYMFCSDGLSDYVPHQIIEHEISSTHSLKTMGETLITTALKCGGNDNITLLLIKVE